MAPKTKSPSPIDKKANAVDWSCRFYTKGCKKATRAKGHLNYAKDTCCRECGDPKGAVHLCAYSNLQEKLNSFQARGGQNIPGTGGPKAGADAKGKCKGKGGKAANGPVETKRESALEKEVADLKRQLGDKGSGDKPTHDDKGADHSGKSTAMVAMWKRNASSLAAYVKHAREEFQAEGENAEAKVQLGLDSDKLPWTLDSQAKITSYQVKIDAALPKDQDMTKQLKAQEATVKKTGDDRVGDEEEHRGSGKGD